MPVPPVQWCGGVLDGHSPFAPRVCLHGLLLLRVYITCDDRMLLPVHSQFFFLTKKKIINFLFVSFLFFFHVTKLCFYMFLTYAFLFSHVTKVSIICDLYNDDDEWMMIWLY